MNKFKDIKENRDSAESYHYSGFEEVLASQSEVIWSYDSPKLNSPKRINSRTETNNEQGKCETHHTTPIRIMKRHVSSPFPDTSKSKIKRLKSLDDFEAVLKEDTDKDLRKNSNYNKWLDGDDSFSISEEQLLEAIREEEVKQPPLKQPSVIIQQPKNKLPQPQSRIAQQKDTRQELTGKQIVKPNIPKPKFQPPPKPSGSHLNNTASRTTRSYPPTKPAPRVLMPPPKPEVSKKPAENKKCFFDSDDSDDAFFFYIPEKEVCASTSSQMQFTEVRFDEITNSSQVVNARQPRS